MGPIELYAEYRGTLLFGWYSSSRSDKIRGSVLALSALLLLGLPTFIGYLVFILQAKLNDARFIPPISAELIGDYTYIGFKYSLFVLVYAGIYLLSIAGIVNAPILTSIQVILIILSIFFFVYTLPATFYLYAKTDKPYPTSKTQLYSMLRNITSYEYMSYILISIFISLFFLLVLVILMLFVITLPLVVFIIWYLSLVFTRMLGYSIQ